MKLQQSGYAGQVEWAEIEKMARKTFTGTSYLDEDYIALIDKARKIYERRRLVVWRASHVVQHSRCSCVFA